MAILPLKPFEKLPFINFLAWRKFWIWSSVAMVLAVFALLGVQGLNYGIDFVGGKLVEIQTQPGVELKSLREAVDEAGFEGAIIQQYGAANDFLIRLPGGEAKVQSTHAEQELLAHLQGRIGQTELRRVEFVGPQVGAELRTKGLQAMIVSILAILVYIWARFEMRFGLGAILSLCHDVILTIGVMCLLQTEITLTVLAAILTLIGYSLNETIVIYDRIRENRIKLPKMPLKELINLSVNQTIGRTIMTGGSVLLVLWSLFLVGGEAIHDFSRVLLIGVLLGTYSSIFVSSSVLLALEEYYRKKQVKA